MFVTTPDFDVAPYTLSNLSAVGNSFADFVTVQEADALRKTMGLLLYDQFMEGLAALPSAYNPATDYAIDALAVSGNDIWKSLQNPNLGQPIVEGAYWTLAEEDNKWLLLKNGATYQTSREWVGMNKMLTPFIYAMWQDDKYSDSTGVAEAKGKAENADTITPKRKIVRAWNEFSRMTGNGKSKVNSLYGFLVVNQDLYPDFVYGDPGRMNIFNL